jgi:DNA-binding LacI/PurR family transcriptional regulator
MIELEWSNDIPVVTVDKQNWFMGQEMVRLMRQRISGNLPSEPQRRIIRPKLVELNVQQPKT